MAKTNKFDGAVVIGAIGYSARTAKVVKLLTSGEVSIGAEYRSADGEWNHRTGGSLFGSLEDLITLVEQAKARQAVSLDSVKLPEPVKAERKPSAQSAKLDALTEQVAALTALMSNMVTANGKAKVAS